MGLEFFFWGTFFSEVLPVSVPPESFIDVTDI